MSSLVSPLLRIASLAGLLPFAFTVKSHAEEPAFGRTATVYVGTYTGGESNGIYRFELDLITGKPSPAALAANTVSPSFLAIHPSRRFLYAVNEVDSFQGKKEGGVSAFAIAPKTGKLTFLNAQSTGGGSPCHLIVDKAGRNVLVVNYGGGSAAVLPIQPNGRLREHSSLIQHKGSSVNKDRQGEPHAHSVNLDTTNNFAFVADLGLDQILIYKFDAAKGAISPNDTPFAGLTPGAGPRHFTFHPGGSFAYVINELNSTVVAWTYDPAAGTLTSTQAITTLPGDFKGGNGPAEVQVHPSGKFLYGSNRGHDSIVVFTIDQETGKLTHVENETEGIKNPRNFAIDPTGTFLLAASQDLDTVVVFKIDLETGALSPTGQSVHVPKPVCLKFWQSPE